jgi:argininosuccinate lyase
MPQKKNPDVAELVRGKTGRLYGHLITLLTLMKAQPLTYNKDNQEDKEPVFDAVDTLSGCLTALTGVMSNLEANKSAMRAAASVGFSTATDLADYLVRKNLPFRDAHEAVGAAVAFAIDTDKGLEELSLNEFQKFSALIEQDGYDVLTLEGSVASRSHAGGTAPKTVRRAILAARNRS